MMDVRELGQSLAQSTVRAAVGLGFALAISWQLLFGGSHVAMWSCIYGSWAAALVCLFVMSRAADDEDGADPVEEAENPHV
jgi:hypothetical protein